MWVGCQILSPIIVTYSLGTVSCCCTNKSFKTLTSKDRGLNIGKKELCLQVLWQENDEAGDDHELHTRSQARHDIDGVH